MYSFEGDFRRKPTQNLAGASALRNTARDSLIQQTQLQRHKREELRKRLNGAITIQAHIRSYLTRKHCKQKSREQFDEIISIANDYDSTFISKLLTLILFFYEDTTDPSRLVSVSQMMLKQYKRVLQIENSSIKVKRLLALHLRLLKNDNEIPVSVPLRMFEVFTSNSLFQNTNKVHEFLGDIFLYLIKRGYFEVLCKLLCRISPPSYGPSPNPPTPMTGAIFDLINRPISLVSHVDSSEYDNTVMLEFASTFLNKAYPEPVECFILPALQNKNFPFPQLVRCLKVVLPFNNHKLTSNSWLLHSVLSLEPPNLASQMQTTADTKLLHESITIDYLSILSELTVHLRNKQISYENFESLYGPETTVNSNDDSDSETEVNPVSVREQLLLRICTDMLNDPSRLVMTACAQISDGDLADKFLEGISEICHNLLLSNRLALHKCRLLYTLAFKPVFLRSLWKWLSGLSHPSGFGGSPTPLLSALARGMGADPTAVPVERLLAPLAVFCSLFSLLIGTLHDTEFCRGVEHKEEEQWSGCGGPSSAHAFHLREMGALSRTLRQTCLGLLELVYPESRQAARHDQPAWSHLFKVMTALVRTLYARDGRLGFSGGAWTEPGAVPEGATAVALVAGARRPAAPLTQEEGPPLTTKELRTVTILKEIPFVVPFSTRVLIFQGLLIREKHDNWYEMTNFNEGPSINIMVRRTHLYEDAFDKLRPENEPNMKLRLRVQLINQAGAEEAGVDGGGLFREFLSELLKSAFDPNRGLFRLTRDNMLYPNPGVHLLYDDFPMHYYFIGRMLGKALYENLLVEVPLAEFFLDKACSGREADVHALASLDPALYRGLLQLRAQPPHEVADLGLDFTLLNDELGEHTIEELKPGGANIPVTAENRIEYIHLVADYKLNKQIRSACVYFKRGLTSVVRGAWLRMFSSGELQLLISGAEVPIDLDDLSRHTHYAGGFSATHPTVQCFWRVMHGFTDAQRRQLLKFVTSCSRPPLLGFKDLQPPFCIQSAGASDRLPSSSTCMNLLKLPEFHEEQLLADKLLYAIQSGAGFELS